MIDLLNIRSQYILLKLGIQTIFSMVVLNEDSYQSNILFSNKLRHFQVYNSHSGFTNLNQIYAENLIFYELSEHPGYIYDLNIIL